MTKRKKKYQRTKEAQRDSISKYEKEESLIIIDALEEYFGDKDTDDKSFKMQFHLVSYGSVVAFF